MTQNPATNRNQRLYLSRLQRTGAFTVEFAICSGIFFTILLAGFEFARFMYARHSIEQAAYESARVGIVPGKTPRPVSVCPAATAPDVVAERVKVLPVIEPTFAMVV